MTNRCRSLVAATACVCFFPMVTAARPASQRSSEQPAEKAAGRSTALEREVALRRITLGVAWLRAYWAKYQVLLAHAESRNAALTERFRRKQFEAFKELNNLEGSYQSIVDKAEARLKRASSAARTAERRVSATDLDLAVAEARVKLEAAKLKRAAFHQSGSRQ